MSASTLLRPAVQAALKFFIDYAGLFPPAELGMDEAIAEYAAAREGPRAWMLGRFIVPAARIEELGKRRKEFPLSVIVNAPTLGGEDTSRWFVAVAEMLANVGRLRDGGARVEALEVPLARPRWQRETFDAAIGQLGALLERSDLRDLTTYAELPRDASWSELLPGAMTAASRARLGVKLRCGGLEASAFPSVEDVAAFVSGATREGLRFKATAGLHHPVRHYDESTGFRMHGFLNLLAAAVFAARVDLETLAKIVAEEDACAFTFEENSFSWRSERAEIEELRVTRRRGFVGYGSCSFSEPVDDLKALGILPESA